MSDLGFRRLSVWEADCYETSRKQYLVADWPTYLELRGVLNLVKVDSALIGQVVEHITCLLSLLATLLEPAHTHTSILPARAKVVKRLSGDSSLVMRSACQMVHV